MLVGSTPDDGAACIQGDFSLIVGAGGCVVTGGLGDLFCRMGAIEGDATGGAVRLPLLAHRPPRYRPVGGSHRSLGDRAFVSCSFVVLCVPLVMATGPMSPTGCPEVCFVSLCATLSTAPGPMELSDLKPLLTSGEVGCGV